jgi:hypothetical protein
MTPQYKVVSDRCSLGELGAIVVPSDMSADNLAALVEGGHIELVTKSNTKTETDTKEKQ